MVARRCFVSSRWPGWNSVEGWARLGVLHCVPVNRARLHCSLGNQVIRVILSICTVHNGGDTARRLVGRGPFEVDSFHATRTATMLDVENIAGNRSPVPLPPVLPPRRPLLCSVHCALSIAEQSGTLRVDSDACLAVIYRKCLLLVAHAVTQSRHTKRLRRGRRE